MESLKGSVVVTGASGMLGSDIMWAFAKEGVQAVPLDHHQVDITDEEAFRETVQRHRPALLINAAAYANVDGCETEVDTAFAVNARGALNIARTCNAVGAFLLHVSTDYVFDGRTSEPYREDDPINPLGVYGKSKAEGERHIREALPDDHCIVRTQWLFGLNGKNFVEAILAKARSDGQLTVVDDQFGSPTSTRDLACAIVTLCRLQARGTFHVVNSGVTSWFHFAQAIVRSAGLAHVSVEPIGSDQLDRPARRPSHAEFDTSKFGDLTGAPLRSWQEALQDYLESRTGRA